MSSIDVRALDSSDGEDAHMATARLDLFAQARRSVLFLSRPDEGIIR